MAGRRTRIVRALLIIFLAVLLLYAGAVGLRVLYPVEWKDVVSTEAAAVGLDPALVCSLVRAESRFHSDAVSPRGAIGLMQLMPDTAAWIAEQIGTSIYDLRDAATSLRLGTWYLRYLADRFGRLDLALAAYNAGPTRVDRWLATGETQYAETSGFVQRVLRSVPVYRFVLGAPILIQITPSLLF